MKRKPIPRLQRQLDALAPEFTHALHAARDAYTALGIRPVLVGGLAVGAWVEPRATTDLDFLAPDSAFEHHGSLITIKRGVPIHAHGLAIDPVVGKPDTKTIFAYVLAHAVPSDIDGVWLADPESLCAMKLVAGRTKDLAAVEDLFALGADPETVYSLVQHHTLAKRALHTVLQHSRSASLRRVMKHWKK